VRFQALLQPTPNPLPKRLEILLAPVLLMIREDKLAPPAPRSDDHGLRPRQLHRRRPSPLERIPAVRLDVVSGDEGEKDDDADVASDELVAVEGLRKGFPAGEEDEEYAEGEAVDGAEDLPVGAVGVVFVIAVVSSMVAYAVVFCCSLEAKEEPYIRGANGCIDNEDGYYCVE